MTAIDEAIWRWVVQHRPSWLSDAARVLTHLGTFWAAVLLLAGATVVSRSSRRRVAIFCAGTVVTHLIVRGAKAAISRPRPPMVARLASSDGWAMPSGHAAMAAYTGAMLWLLLPRRWRGVGPCVAIIVGVTRMVLGVHWATDVLVGWLVGAAVAVGAAALARRPTDDRRDILVRTCGS